MSEKMEKFLTAIVFGMILVLATTSAKADELRADVLHCDGGEIQVCTKILDDATYEVMFHNGTPLFDCSVATELGVELRCVNAEETCGDGKKLCEAMRQRNDHWRWSESECRCDYHRSPQTTPPTTTPPTTNGGSGNGSGGGNTTVTIVQTCNAADFAELSAEMDQIELDLQVVTEMHPLQLRATAVYSRLLECNDGSAEATRLISRAAQLVANFEPEVTAPHDYTTDLERIRETIAGLNDRPIVVNVEPEESWCTGTHAGRWWCIAFPILLGVGAAIAIPVIYDYLEDDSADTNTRYQY